MSEKESNSGADEPASAQEVAEDGSEAKRLPEGMRVVRKRRNKAGGSRQTLFLKKREILREMQDEEAVVGVKEQVERLKSARKAREEGKPVEDRWGGPKTKHSGVRWIFLRIFALTIPVMAIITAFMLVTNEQGRGLMEGFDPRLNVGPDEDNAPPYATDGPVAWFYDHPHEAYSGAVEILDRLSESMGGAVPRDIFRYQGVAEQRIADRGLGWDSKFKTRDVARLTWSTAKTGNTGYVIFGGRCADQSPFRCYFVKAPEGLRLDWEASTGWSEIPIGEMTQRSPQKPVLVRCILGKDPSYDRSDGPDGSSIDSWYLVREEDNSAHVWAYVSTGSALDQKLRRMLRFGLMVLERKEEIRVALRLVKGQGPYQPNEFEIVDLVAEEWVLPDPTAQ